MGKASSVLDVEAAAVADGDGGLDDHDGGGVDLEDEVDDFLDMGGVEEVLVRVIVGGGGDDDEVGLAVCGTPIEGGGEVEGLLGEVALDILVLDGGLALVDEIDFFGDDINGDYFVMLS